MPRLHIISGGQTGADTAALLWAINNNFPHGGWCPKGRLAEGGTIPRMFALQETQSTRFSERTKLNVQDSDGTVIFTVREFLGRGSTVAMREARRLSRPFLHLHRGSLNPGEQLLKFVVEHRIGKLNVGGSRFAKEPTVGTLVKEVLDQYLSLLP